MKTIQLLGELGKRFGREHKLDVKSPAEAVRALIANFPALEKHLMNSGKRVRYRVMVGEHTLPGAERLHDPAGENEVIKFIPVIVGAKDGGVFQTILGAVLVVVGAVLYFTGYGAPLGQYLIMAGVAMMVGGVAQMLTPTPKTTTNVPDFTEQTNTQSYVFNGSVNVTAQGNPVPIGYGRMIVGSAVISAGIQTVDI